MESLSDIVAQMRGRGEDGRMDRRLWLDYADRIEAAAKLESVTERRAVGNAAAMREALERALSVLERYGYANTDCRAVANICDAALSAPARNCDVGTADAQQNRFNRFCKPCSDSCPFSECKTIVECAIKWLQTPYAAAEGGAE